MSGWVLAVTVVRPKPGVLIVETPQMTDGPECDCSTQEIVHQ